MDCVSIKVENNMLSRKETNLKCLITIKYTYPDSYSFFSLSDFLFQFFLTNDFKWDIWIYPDRSYKIIV